MHEPQRKISYDPAGPAPAGAAYPAARLDYSLPPELIAQQPLKRRGASRMLHVRRSAGGFADRMFADLPELLPPRCLIVLNDSRVIPARLYGERAVDPLGRGGGRVEVLLHRWLGEGVCEAVVGSGAAQSAGECVLLPAGWRCELLSAKGADGARVRYLLPNGRAAELPELLAYLERYGRPPLPPYIKRPGGQAEQIEHNPRGGRPPCLPAQPDSPQAGTVRQASVFGPVGQASVLAATGSQAGTLAPPAETLAPPVSDDRERYQTVYAQQPGSVAAPTAGLHFESAMLDRLRADGHELAMVTLHVGLGTFAPLRVADLREHSMHEEAYSVSPESCRACLQAREQRRPVLAVGTTSLRVLHTLSGADGSARDSLALRPAPLQSAGTAASPTEGLSGLTRAFIYPGRDTDAADLLLTNFHLPRSTLLALVYSFGGEELLRAAYAHAIAQRYRFFSYGDCMLIDRR